MYPRMVNYLPLQSYPPVPWVPPAIGYPYLPFGWARGWGRGRGRWWCRGFWRGFPLVWW